MKSWGSWLKDREPLRRTDMNAKTYKFHEKVGPGGLRCPCCTKGRPVEAKRLNNRRFRRTAKKAVQESC